MKNLHIDDLIILGRAVPVEMKREHLHTICVGGWSREHDFIRIYPALRDTPLERWSVVELDLKRSRRDNRPESWKIPYHWRDIREKVIVHDKINNPKQRKAVIAPLEIGCVEELNQEKKSLGIIKPRIEECRFVPNPKFTGRRQRTIDGRLLPLTKRNFRFMPKIKYHCRHCQLKTIHDQQLIDWGTYMWMQNEPERLDEVWNALKLNRKDRRIYFFVGNQRDQRTSFLIISVFSVPIGKYQSSLDKYI